MTQDAQHCLAVVLSAKTLADAGALTNIGIGAGHDIAVRELAELIKQTAGFRGEIVFDPSKPGGMPRKLLDITRLNAPDWHYSTQIKGELAQTYANVLTQGEWS